MVVALEQFQRHLPGPMIVIWDRSTTHRAVVVKESRAAHPELHVEWLPPYAPDLNPEEGCHGNVKQHLRNATPVSINALRAQVDRGFARLRQDRKSTRLNSSHANISYAVFCLKKKKR